MEIFSIEITYHDVNNKIQKLRWANKFFHSRKFRVSLQILTLLFRESNSMWIKNPNHI